MNLRPVSELTREEIGQVLGVPGVKYFAQRYQDPRYKDIMPAEMGAFAAWSYQVVQAANKMGGWN